MATRKSYVKSHRRPADLHLPAFPSPSSSTTPPLSTIGVTVSLESVALCCRVSRQGGSPPATLKPPPPPLTKLGLAQTQLQRWITACDSDSIFEATGLREAVILVKQLQGSLPPPMRALSLFAVASFTLLIKPLSERERERPVLLPRVSSANFRVLLAT